MSLFDQNEDVDGEDAGENHNEVENGSSRQNNAKASDLISEQLVFQGRHTEVGAVLDLVEALGTPVDSRLRQTDKEGHQDKGQDAECKHRDHSKQVTEQTWLVLDDRVRHGVAVRALDFGRPRWKI